MSGQAHARDRELDFERWWNVRDLGGLPTVDGGTTRFGRVFRSASPEWATDADVERALALGLTSFVGLRRERPGPDWRHRTEGVRYQQVNLLGGLKGPRIGSAPELLRALLDQGRSEIAAAIRTIVDLGSDGPVVFHCHTGKDRTGIVAVLLLKLAGVPHEDIVDDFLASNPGFAEMWTEFTRDDPASFMSGAPEAFRGPALAESAEAALGFIDAAGGAAAYLQSGGLSAEEVEQAAARLKGGSRE